MNAASLELAGMARATTSGSPLGPPLPKAAACAAPGAADVNVGASPMAPDPNVRPCRPALMPARVQLPTPELR
eukprot:14379524-Alexandrium_andersonii.AAC.1